MKAIAGWSFCLSLRWWLGTGSGDILQCTLTGYDLVTEQLRLAMKELLMFLRRY